MSEQQHEQAATQDPAAVRRERGVLAQRAYRKRHATKFQALQEENERLRTAIRHVSAVANAGGLFTGELKEALRRARETAGLQETEPENQQRPEGEEPTTFVSSTSRTSPAEPAGAPDHAAPMTAILVANTRGPSPRSLEVPMNSRAYLDADAGSVAGCIYRVVLFDAIQRWNSHLHSLGQPEISQPPLQHPFPSVSSPTSAASSAAHPPHHQASEASSLPYLSHRNDVSLCTVCVFSPPPSSATRPHCRQAPSTTPGSNDSSSSSSSSNTPTCDHSLIANRRPNQGWWRASDGIETYLRQQLTPEGLEKLKRVLNGGGTELQKKHVDGYLGGCTKNYKCFGDGPRWNAVYVKLAIDMLAQGLAES